MLAAAEEAGFGADRQLARSFVKFQEAGLLGKASAKAPRRGGEGLWPDGQAKLWLDLLSARAEGIEIWRLLHAPVYLWLISDPAVNLDQAQTAWHNFASRYPKPGIGIGRETYHNRGLTEQAKIVINPNARPRAANYEYRTLFGNIVNAGVLPSVEAIAACLREIWPEMPDDQVLEYALGQRRVIEIQHLAIAHRDDLRQTTREVKELWARARVILIETYRCYLLQLPHLIALPGIGRLCIPDFLGESTLPSSAATHLTSVLGLGICYQKPNSWVRGNWPAELPRPPRIRLTEPTSNNSDSYRLNPPVRALNHK